MAREVAQYAAIYLEATYGRGDSGKRIVLSDLADHTDAASFREKAAEALKRLEKSGRLLDLPGDLDKPDWGELYTYFFENHLASPNRQREFLSELISKAGNRLNWAHVCLGELVRRGYVGTIMTTNFDQLAFQAVTKTGTLPVIADGLEALDRVLAEPTQPQIIYLHGSMNTYSPRNSRMAVRGTGGHKVLPAVLYSLLHRSDLLVVVGYAGGEEGVMQLLRSIAEQLPSLVIFWVLYESDESALSQRAAELLSIGENKFLLTEFGADELMRDLMNELGIGTPRWIEEPFELLEEDARRLNSVKDDPDVDALISRLRALAAAAAAGKSIPSREEKAATGRLAGDYNKALEAFEGETAAEARLSRAQTRFRQAQETRKREDQIKPLNEALGELEPILTTLSGPNAERAALLNFRVLLLKRDAQEEDSAEMRRAIIDASELWRRVTPKPRDSRREAEILLGLGHAQLEEGERCPPDDIESLRQAEASFKAALGLVQSPGSRQFIEAKSGLASALQLIGDRLRSEPDQQQSLLREAVNEHLQLVAISTASSDPADQADRCENAANAVKRLAETYEGGGKAGLLRQAKSLAQQAANLLRSLEGKAEDYARVEKLLRELRG